MIAVLAFTARLAAADAVVGDEAEETTSVDPAWADAANAASFDPAWSDAGSADDREAARRAEPTRIGRIDLTITWRRTVRTTGSRTIDASAAIASPLDPETTARGVLWMLVTWSR